MINIVLVDDDPFVCMSLKTILEADPEVKVTALGHSGEEAIALCEDGMPDILLMDIQMGKISGIQAGKELLKKYPEGRILFLTTFSDDEYIVDALRIGAKGYLIKQDIASIAPALKAVMSGQNVFGNEIVQKLPHLMAAKKDTTVELPLNEREMDVVRLVAKGLNNKEIAGELFLSEGTVRNYLSQILEKLELRDRTQLAVLYLESKNR